MSILREINIFLRVTAKKNINYRIAAECLNKRKFAYSKYYNSKAEFRNGRQTEWIKQVKCIKCQLDGIIKKCPKSK